MEWSLTTLARPWTPRCKLLELPREIRDLIYEFALTSEKPIVTFRLDSYQRDSYEEATQPPLTRVSRQVRHETLPIYCGINDFTLHTEGSKLDRARRWLLCNNAHLGELRHLSLWVRHVTLTNDRTGSNGALCISIRRDMQSGCWKVRDDWKWITVVRKPSALEGDAEFLMNEMRRMLVNESTSHMDADELGWMLTELKMLYVKEKMSWH